MNTADFGDVKHRRQERRKTPGAVPGALGYGKARYREHVKEHGAADHNVWVGQPVAGATGPNESHPERLQLFALTSLYPSSLPDLYRISKE